MPQNMTAIQVIHQIERALINPATLAVNTDVVLFAVRPLGLPHYSAMDLIEKIFAYADVLTDFFIEKRKEAASDG